MRTRTPALDRREPLLSRAEVAVICNAYGKQAHKLGRGVGMQNACRVSGDFGEQAAPASAARLQCEPGVSEFSGSHMKYFHCLKMLRFIHQTCHGPAADFLESSPASGSHI